MKFTLLALTLCSDPFKIFATAQVTVDSNIDGYAEVKYWNLKDSAYLNPPLDDGSLGGMKFSPNGDKFCVVAAAEETAFNATLHCMDVTRDSTTGQITDFANPQIIFKKVAMDVGFSEGPGGKDFFSIYDEEIAQGAWDWSGPTPTFTEQTQCLFNLNDATGDVPFGMDFNPVKKDPTTNHGMMTLALEEYGIWEVPLILNSTTGCYEPEIKVATAGEFEGYPLAGTQLCYVDSDYPGDIRFIPTGEYANDILYVDWDNAFIYILPIDDDPTSPTVGYPFVDDGTRPFNRATATAATYIADPVKIPFLNMSASRESLGADPWGMVFDPITKDFLVSIWDDDDNAASIFMFRGFSPGIDINVVSSNLEQSLTDAIDIINGGRRMLRDGSSKRTKLASRPAIESLGIPSNAGECACSICELNATTYGVIAINKKNEVQTCVNSNSVKNGRNNVQGLPSTCDLSECAGISDSTNLQFSTESFPSSAEDIVANIQEGGTALLTESIAAVVDIESASIQQVFQSGEDNDVFAAKAGVLKQVVTDLEIAYSVEIANLEPALRTEVAKKFAAAEKAANLIGCIPKPLDCSAV